MKGIQGWMAEIERKQKRMARFGGAAAVLAILAAGRRARARDHQPAGRPPPTTTSTTSEQALDGTQDAVKQATEKQLKSLNETVASLEQRLHAEKQQAQTATTIATLQSAARTRSRLRRMPRPPIGAPGAASRARREALACAIPHIPGPRVRTLL